MFSLVRLLWHSYLPHVKDEPSNRVPACKEDQKFLVESRFFGSKAHYEFPQGGIFLPHEYCIHTKQYIVCLSSDLQRITYCMKVSDNYVRKNLMRMAKDIVLFRLVSKQKGGDMHPSVHPVTTRSEQILRKNLLCCSLHNMHMRSYDF